MFSKFFLLFPPFEEESRGKTQESKLKNLLFPPYLLLWLLVLFIAYASKAEVFHAAVFGGFHPAGYAVAGAVAIVT
jgi:hypothetical protein